jgi:soluble lytic murein transglycosylase
MRHFLPFARALLLGAFTVAAVWQTGPLHAGPSPEATRTATPTPPPATPTPSPPDAALAAKFAWQGRFEAAIAAYLAVVEQGTSEERLAARLGLARVYLDDGQTASAVHQLDAYLLEASAAEDVRAAQYLLAEALALQGEWDQALPLYDAYIEADGGAATYARLGRAEALASLGRVPEAILEARRLLDGELPRSVRLALILAMAQTLEASHPNDALSWYDRLRRESQSPADQALALWRTASIQYDLGDATARVGAWTAVIQRFPETSTAQAIVDEAPPGNAGLDSYYIGLVYYRGGHDREARAAFETSFESNRKGPDHSLAARASYYLAVLDESAGDIDEAVRGYGRVVELDPSVELADDALWWRGRLLELAGRIAEAADSYRRLLSAFDSSNWAPEARFRLALLDYDQGDFDEAADGLAAVAEEADSEERQRALLWRGKALAEAGDETEAEAAWRALREEAPIDYYGLRAAVLLGEARGGLWDAGLTEAEEPSWAAIEAWVLVTGSGNPWEALKILLYDRHWALGRELLSLGMDGRATDEFRLILEAADGEPYALYQLARLFHSAGMTHLSSQAAARLLWTVPGEAAEGAPGDLWRLAYPAPFSEVLREEADIAEVPELLLLALIRQESFFDPLAGSSAGARGLTQVMSATGEAIARDLAWADFEVGDLYRPSVSLRFGAHYLAEQIDLFDGNIYEALAAYNGGPGNALRWADTAGDDIDRFVEEIEFSETEAYVRLVTENLARYRQLYRGLEEPSLPRD